MLSTSSSKSVTRTALSEFSAGKMSSIAAHPEDAAPELEFVALILHLAQPLDGVALVSFSLAQMQDHAVILAGSPIP